MGISQPALEFRAQGLGSLSCFGVIFLSRGCLSLGGLYGWMGKVYEVVLKALYGGTGF